VLPTTNFPSVIVTNTNEKFKYEGKCAYVANSCIQQLLVEGTSGGFHMGDGERAVVECDKCQFLRRSVLVSTSMLFKH
jgi:hypothetical protein